MCPRELNTHRSKRATMEYCGRAGSKAESTMRGWRVRYFGVVEGNLVALRRSRTWIQLRKADAGHLPPDLIVPASSVSGWAEIPVPGMLAGMLALHLLDHPNGDWRKKF